MVVTISTHNGSSVAHEHNVRNEKVVVKEIHIDMDGCHEIWKDEPVRKAYERLFGAAVEEYNEKQSRPERRINSYYHDVCKDKKKHPVYEMVIGIYGKKEDGSPVCSDELGKAIMQEFVRNWKERNPNLEMIGAYYHADEPAGQPHVHIDYIPVAHGYTKGLHTQTGLAKALGEQGFTKSGKATAQIQWEKRENDYLTSLCESHRLIVSHPRIEDAKHIATKEFKLQSKIKELEETLEKKNSQLQETLLKNKELENRNKELESKVADAKQELSEVNVQYDVTNEALKKILDKKARASEIHKLGELFGETQTYHKNMLDKTRNIGSEAYKDLDEAKKLQQDIAVREQRVKQKEAAINPLHQQAQSDALRAKKLREEEEELIEKKASELSERKIASIMQSTPTAERDRMRKYMDTLKFSDGTTALEHFEEAEKQLEQKLLVRSRFQYRSR